MYSRAFENEEYVICRACLAPLRPRHFTKIMTCPYCGALLIISGGKTFTVRKRDSRGWFWFNSTPLREGVVGIVKTTSHTIEFSDNGTILVDGIEMSQESLKKNLGKVIYIWGEIPLIVKPYEDLEELYCKEKY